jgi:hypothetical protein
MNSNRKSKVKLITEEAPFANEITWGDSFLGRLINSAMRKASIGYNATRVDSLVKAFKRELDSLVTMGLQTETKNKFNSLLIKSYLQKLQNICQSSQTDEEKLKELLGSVQKITRQNQQGQDEEIWINSSGDLVWDTKLPNGGMWKDIIEDGYLRYVFEDIDLNRNKEELKKIGADKDLILDSFSDLIDNYRRLTSPTEDSSTSQRRYAGFLRNFGVLNPVLNNLVTASYKYNPLKESVISFSQFIYENQEDKTGTTASTSTQPQTEKEKPSGEEVKFKDKAEMLKNLSIKIKDKKTDEKNFLEDEDVKKYYQCLLSLTDEEISYIQNKNPESKIKIDNKELPIGEALKKLRETLKKDQQEGEKESKKVEESLIVRKFNKNKLFESVTEGSIEEIFNNFKESVNNPSLFEVTQREVDEANKLAGPDSQKILIDLSKNPDPILKIIRIFKRAHDLFFTPMIPSGRTGGKVSVKTYNEYIKLGGGSTSLSTSSDSNAVTPGYGPFAVKKIYDKFRDGILEVLEDQKYRKILSNVEFVVPGSEDTFNKKESQKESSNDIFKLKDFMKIFEAEKGKYDLGRETDSSGATKKQSHGQILMDFINDLLDGESMADFDSSRRRLLTKYFDKFGVDSKLGQSSKQPVVQPTKLPKAPPGATEENSLSWDSINNDQKFKCQDENTGGYKGAFYIIPIKQEDGREIIVLHAIKEVKISGNSCTLVKFVFNDSTKFTDKISADKPEHKCERAFTIGDTGKSGSVYFGIINKFPTADDGFKIKMVYAKVKDPSSTDNVIEKEFTTEKKTKGADSCSRMVLKITKGGRVETWETDWGKKIKNERDSHVDNMNELRIGGTKTIEELKTKAENYFKQNP